MTPQISWTLVNVFYLAEGSLFFRVLSSHAYVVVMSHVPLGVYDDQEQIDGGAQYTPEKK